MNKTKAKRMFENARREIIKAQESSVEAMNATQREYRWGALNPVYKPLDFDAVGATQFLGEYCYAVFTSGFRTAIVAQHAQAIAKAFKNFDLDALARIDSIDLAVVPIKNERKVKDFLKGAKAIANEGFKAFKARLKEGGMDVLGELPWMGRANRQHLAMIFGLADTAKDDVWLRRCAEEASFPALAPSFPSSMPLGRPRPSAKSSALADGPVPGATRGGALERLVRAPEPAPPRPGTSVGPLRPGTRRRSNGRLRCLRCTRLPLHGHRVRL